MTKEILIYPKNTDVKYMNSFYISVNVNENNIITNIEIRKAVDDDVDDVTGYLTCHKINLIDNELIEFYSAVLSKLRLNSNFEDIDFGIEVLIIRFVCNPKPE